MHIKVIFILATAELYITTNAKTFELTPNGKYPEIKILNRYEI